MGKAAILLVAVSLVTLTASNIIQRERQVDSAEEEGLYAGKIVVREIARSGFDVIERRVRRNFENVRGTWSNIKQGEGTYTISATGEAAGPVTITSKGRFREFEYTISGILERDNESILDALTIDGEIGNPKVDSKVVISGMDTDPDGSDGGGTDVHAVLATFASAYAALADEIDRASQAPGVGGAPDVVNDTSRFSLAGFVSGLDHYDGDALASYSKSQKFKNKNLGDEDDPVVLVVDGDVTLEGDTEGYGILYAKGAITMEDDAYWQGIVYMAKDGEEFKMDDDARVVGAVIMSAFAPDEIVEDANDRGLPGGHFDIDVFSGGGSTAEIYHEHQYDDDYDVRGVDLKSPDGCKSNGGLCWSQLLSGETGIILDIENESKGYGTYTLSSAAGKGCSSGGGSGSSSYSGSVRGKYSKRKGWSESSWSSDGCSGSWVDIPAVSLTGSTQNGLTGVVMDARKVSSIDFQFTALCSLQLSSPGNVQKDATDRNGAFTIKIYRAKRTGSNWSRSTQIYELVIYHHAGYGKWVLHNADICDPNVSDEGGVEGVVRYGSAMSLELKKDARIQFSSQALRGLSDIIPELEQTQSGIVRRRVREAVRTID